MGEPHLIYARLTHSVDYFLEHMEVLFSRVGKLSHLQLLHLGTNKWHKE
ncbi:hypothetical protein CsSME_00046210 [Camellia sinensis var. sinensis]